MPEPTVMEFKIGTSMVLSVEVRREPPREDAQALVDKLLNIAASINQAYKLGN